MNSTTDMLIALVEGGFLAPFNTILPFELLPEGNKELYRSS